MSAQPSTQETEDKWRLRFCGYLSIGEGLIYVLLALLLGCTADRSPLVRPDAGRDLAHRSYLVALTHAGR